MIDIKQIPQEKVLAALYNKAKPQGMGFLHYTPEDMTFEEAKEILESGQTYFDYHNGRVMKVDLSDSNEFDEWLFDRDNGNGAAQDAIDSIVL